MQKGSEDMLYKIGTVAEVERIPFENAVEKETVYRYASILTEEYGADRDVDANLGGYILYATDGTDAEEIKAMFDYSVALPEYVDICEKICVAVYVISDDYGVVIVMSIADATDEILKYNIDKLEEEK